MYLLSKNLHVSAGSFWNTNKVCLWSVSKAQAINHYTLWQFKELPPKDVYTLIHGSHNMSCLLEGGTLR